jgi:hypothetical protein
MTVGFVFKADGELFLTKYLGEGEFSDGFPISNNEPYKDLGNDQLALVEAKEVQRGNGDIAFIIKDYHFITIGNESIDDIRGCDILLDPEARESLSKLVEDQAEELGIDI